MRSTTPTATNWSVRAVHLWHISRWGVGRELPAETHPYYVGNQAHPELKSRPTQAHPLFHGLIAAALCSHAERQ